MLDRGLAIKLRKFGRICPLKGYKEESVRVGAPVIVETDRGVEFGEIISLLTEQIKRAAQDIRLRKVLRYATEEEAKRNQQLVIKERESLALGIQKIKEYELPIRLVEVEHIFDGSRIVFYYKAEEGKKTDLKNLIRDLSSVFKTRIEMQLVSPRDEARLFGGLGPCGRPLCCAMWLEKYPRVTVKMAKEQGLAIGPTRSSGLCGRLMCCLGYEYPPASASPQAMRAGERGK